MKTYLDSSALVAWFDPNNPHYRRVVAWREDVAAEFVFNRLLDLECSHYFRQNRAEHAGLAMHAFNQAVAARRFHFQSVSPLDLFRDADLASRRLGRSVRCGFWDLCHISAAQRGGWVFVSADRAQTEAAEIEGLETVFVGPKS